MPQTTLQKLDTPSSTQVPDVVGDLQILASEIDARLGAGGMERVDNYAAVQAIPTARCFNGKLALAYDTGYVYRFWAAAWHRWQSAPADYTPTFSGLTLGNGTANACSWWSEGALRGRVALTWGSTTTNSGSLLFNLPELGADTTYWHIGTGYVHDFSGFIQPMIAVLTTANQFALKSTADGSTASATVPYTLAAGDRIQVAYEVKF